jgi:CDP-4-dehydro-6-deoxyglucose reductase
MYTEHVFAQMKEKDILRFNGPHGFFFLREDSQKPMVMVAGGTGFAPIKSIVEHAIAENCKRPITVYWGGRSRIDLYQLGQAESWSVAHANIRFVPVLAEPAADDAWTGRTGFVHQAVMADFPDLSGHQVYACGSPAMIAAAKRDFHDRCKLAESEFFADSFDFANDKG